MEDGALAVGGRVDIDFHDVGTGCKGGLHGGNRILEQGVFGRVDAFGGAGVVLEVGAGECVMDAAMRDEAKLRVGWRSDSPGCVPDPDGGASYDKNHQYP